MKGTNSPADGRRRCRHAFEVACVHANGDVVCSMIDGRGDFVLGNVHRQSLPAIFEGSRARELREIVASTPGDYCGAVGRRCPLKALEAEWPRDTPARIRYLTLEPTTACSVRCLACPARDLSPAVGWRDGLADGGPAFFCWDLLRRGKQAAADLLQPFRPVLAAGRPGPLRSLLLRGRIPGARAGTLPIDVLRRVVAEAGPAVERVDLFGYGEPFLYPQLVAALRHVRAVLPAAEIVVSTSGIHVDETVERTIVEERLVDWLIFSVDGCNPRSYGRYRVGGRFETAFGNLVRCHGRARGTTVRVVWQYVVFRWNDSDAELARALSMAAERGITLQFDFARTWGRSRRRASGLEFLRPHLRPFTALPGEARQNGW